MDGWMPGRPGRQVAARRDVAVRGVPGDVRGEVCGACARDEPNDATRRDDDADDEQTKARFETNV
jgi:hypothetical protein